jgi:hypothetical protein
VDFSRFLDASDREYIRTNYPDCLEEISALEREIKPLYPLRFSTDVYSRFAALRAESEESSRKMAGQV